jgi:hypothetical protein
MKQISNSTSTEREYDQNLILKLPRKSKQHLMVLHFHRPHRSRTGVPCNTSNSDSASTSRCLSDPNLSQCQIKSMNAIILYSCYFHLFFKTVWYLDSIWRMIRISFEKESFAILIRIESEWIQPMYWINF